MPVTHKLTLTFFTFITTLCLALPKTIHAQEYRPHQIIVTYKQNQTPEALENQASQSLDQFQDQLFNRQTANQKLQQLHQTAQATSLRQERHLSNQPTSPLHRSRLLEFEPDTDTLAALRQYSQLETVESVQLNYLFSIARTPNDPSYSNQQWHYEAIHLPEAWDLSIGTSDTTVAILDTGIDYNHQDLPGNRLTLGYDYVNNDNDPLDDHNHGTFIAGTIAALTDNNQGVSGVNWNTNLYIAKVLNQEGTGDTTGIIQAINDATTQGAHVINLSLGAPVSCDSAPTFQSAITNAWQNDVTVVAAAGNSNQDAQDTIPASCDHVITVGATNANNQRAGYSNYGSHVDIAAPAGDGTSYSDALFSTVRNNNYDYGLGTSYAAPHVTGVVSLMHHLDSEITPDTVETTLVQTGTSITTDQPIGPLVNAHQALQSLNTNPPPSQPGDYHPIDDPDGHVDINDFWEVVTNYLSTYTIFDFNQVITHFGS